MKWTVNLTVALLLASALAPTLPAQDKTPPPPAQPAEKPGPAADQPVTAADLERQFSSDLSGSQLVGYFTLDGAEEAGKLKADRYRLGAVTKVKDDYWLFTYSHLGTPIPLMLKVLWAGKTPVLTLDEFTIPGMGTFSARVMFHGSRYAGTWQHGQKGGLMFGHLEKAVPVGKPSADKPATDEKIEVKPAPKSDNE